MTKPLFPLAATATTVFTARIIDRVGKGICKVIRLNTLQVSGRLLKLAG